MRIDADTSRRLFREAKWQIKEQNEARTAEQFEPSEPSSKKGQRLSPKSQAKV
jgi:hypothetical protein